MKGVVFLNLLHEIFHIIIYNEGMNIKDRGKEPIVNALGNGLVKVLKQNKKVRNFIYDCFEKKKKKLYNNIIYKRVSTSLSFF